MSNTIFNKFRAAAEVLQRGRDLFVESMAEEVLDQGDDLLENGFQFNEFLETQGTRLHFLTMVLSQLEQSADNFDERVAAMPPPPKAGAIEQTKKRRSRAKKLPQKASAESSNEES
jgi:hypothetical protein